MALADVTKMQLVDWLDDLSVRFLINLPASELSAVPRMCFQVEEAQWYYEDFIRPAAAAAGNPLPSLSLRQFCLLLFQHCPLLSGFTDAQHVAAYEEFLAYKVRVPVRGAILMDQSMEKLVLVKGWKKGASWSFPRGKINKDEKDLDCAIREVYEECGYDIRQAGLIPTDESEVKYIDITMREQHMQLFVFRGIPEDTYFEPKTRKEISKIAWYNVRDLPGFRKQKGNAPETAAGLANKFYMVAPFLGPLKKWINREREKDVAKASRQEIPLSDYENDVTEPTAEDEGGLMEPDQGKPELVVPVPEKSEELKRLMGIGGSAPAPAQSLTPMPMARPLEQQSNGLLALLHGVSRVDGSAQTPHTQLEQIQSIPRQTEGSQQYRPTAFPMAYQQNTPVPQRLQYDQQQQRHASFPTHQAFETGQGVPTQQHYPSLWAIPPVHDHNFQQRQSVPNNAYQPSLFAPQDGMSLSGPWQPLPQAPQMQVHMQDPWQQRLSVAPNLQGIQGTPSNGPAVPNANHLPMPKINAHTTSLLDAFRSGATPALSGSKASHTARHPSQHQTALLDLFRKPSVVQTSTPAPKATSPTLTDVTERPPRLQERRPTLNEITRTLPRTTKAKSPVESETHSIPQAPVQIRLQPAQPVQPPLQPVRATPQPVQAPQQTLQAQLPTPKLSGDRPKSRQLYNPNDHKSFIRASAESLRAETDLPVAPITILQRPPGSVASRSPKLAAQSPKTRHAPSSPPKRPAKDAENGHPTPTFTILARPGSARGSIKSTDMPPSSLRSEVPNPAFQPQVLKRAPPDGVNLNPSAIGPSQEQVPANSTIEKRDQLLALFGKGVAATPSPIQPGSKRPARTPTATEADKPKNGLLDLFTIPQTMPVADTSTPLSPAPQVLPERKASRPTPTSKPSHALLELFEKPAFGPQHSPGTPISPFTLGTPVQKEASKFAEHERPSRLGSVTSATGSSVSSPPLSRPAEANEILLKYLHGVVQKQRHRAG